MKKFRSVIAAVMAATMVLTMTACDEEVTPSGGNSNSNGNGGTPPSANGGAPAQNSGAGGESSSSETLASARPEWSDDDVINAAKGAKEQLDDPDMTVDTRIKWLAWYDIVETTAAAELFKEVYGAPANGDDPEREGKIFEWMNVSWGNRFDRLSSLIQSGDSPDIFPFEGTDFPYGIIMNRYQPVDDLFDFTAPKWAAASDMMDQFTVKGKRYCAFWDITLSSLMWYRKSNIVNMGVEDPQELFAQGKWDWDAFLNISREWKRTGTTDSPKWGIDGFGAEDNILVSTGVPMVTNIGDGKLQSNLHDPNLERVIAHLNTIREEGIVYPRQELNSWSVNLRAWANSDILFTCSGIWTYESDLRKFKKAYKWDDDEIKVVPFPKDPQTDKHYVSLKQDSFMWVKGSTNKNGVKAWIDCNACVANDAAVTEASKKQSIENPDTAWTAELLDFLNPLYKLDGTSPVTPVIEFKTGLGPSVYDSSVMDNAISSMASYPYLTGAETFVTLREQNEGAINAAIDDINKAIDKL